MVSQPTRPQIHFHANLINWRLITWTMFVLKSFVLHPGINASAILLYFKRCVTRHVPVVPNKLSMTAVWQPMWAFDRLTKITEHYSEIVLILCVHTYFINFKLYFKCSIMNIKLIAFFQQMKNIYRCNVMSQPSNSSSISSFNSLSSFYYPCVEEMAKSVW
jgi:hypothetical protein